MTLVYSPDKFFYESSEIRIALTIEGIYSQYYEHEEVFRQFAEGFFRRDPVRLQVYDNPQIFIESDGKRVVISNEAIWDGAQVGAALDLPFEVCLLAMSKFVNYQKYTRWLFLLEDEDHLRNGDDTLEAPKYDENVVYPYYVEGFDPLQILKRTS